MTSISNISDNETDINETDSYTIRDKTIISIKSIDNIKLSDLEIKDLEIGIFNWTIDFCIKNGITKNWDNNMFRKTYISKAVSVLSNLDPKQYLKNKHLLNVVQKKQIKPHEIPYMKNEEIFPENWNHIKTTLEKKVESLKNNKNISITDQFKCGKCNKRECSYYELQIRSADESATLFITCLNCNAKWRQ
jgi:DNA-directed RNA polymerase subunit M/transcription elongation factor TFIIS